MGFHINVGFFQIFFEVEPPPPLFIKGLNILRHLALGHLAQPKSHSVFRSRATSHLSQDQRHVLCLEVWRSWHENPVQDAQEARVLKRLALLKATPNLEGRPSGRQSKIKFTPLLNSLIATFYTVCKKTGLCRLGSIFNLANFKNLQVQNEKNNEG